MRKRLFDHIDLRVRDRQRAQQFYEQVLPVIGFRIDKSGDEWGQFNAEGDNAVEFFGFTEDASHQPNGTRIAFWADSRAAVNRIAEIVRQAGGRNIEGPELCIDYSPGYYAVFFDDPDGNKLEVCFRESPIAPS